MRSVTLCAAVIATFVGQTASGQIRAGPDAGQERAGVGVDQLWAGEQFAERFGVGFSLSGPGIFIRYRPPSLSFNGFCAAPGWAGAAYYSSHSSRWRGGFWFGFSQQYYSVVTSQSLYLNAPAGGSVLIGHGGYWPAVAYPFGWWGPWPLFLPWDDPIAAASEQRLPLPVVTMRGAPAVGRHAPLANQAAQPRATQAVYDRQRVRRAAEQKGASPTASSASNQFKSLLIRSHTHGPQ